MKLASCIFATLTSSLALAASPPPVFPISNPKCPVASQPRYDSVCGNYTYKFGEACPRYSKARTAYQGPTEPKPYTDYVDPPKDYLVDVDDYAFYHMLHVEYLVEFSKHPMPFQKPLSLPYCGIETSRAIAKRDDALVEERWKIGGTVGKIGEGLKKFAEKVKTGVAPILAPYHESHRDYRTKGPKLIPRPYCIPASLTIPVHFTIFTSNYTTAALVNITTLEKQVQVTNVAFAPLGISFFISSVNYHVGSEWGRFTHNKNGGDDHGYSTYSERIKTENRYGGNDEVNVWIVESIGSYDCQKGVYTSGYCSLARNLNTANHIVDGCALTIDSLPGVTFRGGVGTGSTLTHELGHWLDLPHIFPKGFGSGCTGESDDITDTWQFPNDGSMWSDRQKKCCSTGEGQNKKWDFCPDGSYYNVTNYMSYSGQKGKYNPSDDPGTMPWTTEQRAHMYAAFYTLRRPPPKSGISCNNYPVWWDETPYLTRRTSAEPGKTKLRDLKGPSLLSQSSHLLEHLKRICSTPPDASSSGAIDVISGELLKCDPDGNCQPPTKGLYCPDGKRPPCELEKYCTDGSLAPCKEAEYYCEDGTAPPCPDMYGSYPPEKPAPACPPPSCPPPSCPPPPYPLPSCPSYPGATWGGAMEICADGSKPVCYEPGGKYHTSSSTYPPGTWHKTTYTSEPTTPTSPPGPPRPEYNATCPAGCNVHYNSCDKTTAPTCIYPDPRVPRPRGACACRPGYKASGYADTDTTKQWRLPIPGQEHRVWVAENVVCDKLCVISGGVESCREVSAIALECARY
ncbi:hypothetical protein B0H67DRAFT_54042 [Lasiosphaeris hirsuta]|uniref:Peptidase M43 pregnancy-associated plasma-A domain-containing protein n=1 Tax=Lasiosphaeris hirsuta TaxID=260670 RepID=A0AA40BB12_9PEZI|nr:hypothetical protein B0H67DRAFT_54042 [Lasiosphaeris hirsuta]